MRLVIWCNDGSHCVFYLFNPEIKPVPLCRLNYAYKIFKIYEISTKI